MSIPKDTADLVNMLQAKLASTDSALAAMKEQQSLHDMAMISMKSGDIITTIEHIASGVFIALMLLFLFYLARNYTFGKWTAENPNPYKDETLGMPKGTMRGVITFTLLFFMVFIELHVIRNPLLETWTEKFITSFQMVLAFYFGSQMVNSLSTKEVEKTQTKAMADVVVASSSSSSGSSDTAKEETGDASSESK